ncbi:MAG: threo-3-hydroxy-L-aspartate ammonia-lyase [Planctomycetes bacterium]|nr:threo-3-hydroxy-L-aspartate ammonia-lyase [Planctomycetota bacterium]
MSVSIDDIRAAAAHLEGLARKTPVYTCHTVDDNCGAKVFFKCENFQRVGAFKFRGAYNALSQLAEARRAAGVLTFSSGNHGQAIALAGKLLGIPAVIVMPKDAPGVKIAATKGYGAEIVLYDKHQTTRELLGAKIAGERGLTVIPPYDHAHIIAGQGTVALELHDEVAGLDVLIAPVGGGGLISGCAVATKVLRPSCKVIGIEPENADDATRSFKTGELQTVNNPDTVADGARTPSLGKLTFPLIRECVDDMITVSDDAIVTAMRFIWERMKLVVEPTGAMAYAALHSGALDVTGKRVGVVISGGNVDLDAMPLLFA